MRYILQFFLLALGLTICTYSLCAQSSKQTNSVGEITKTTELQPPKPVQSILPSPESTEIQMYKLLYNDSRDANSRIINTLQWSIGLGAAFLLALVGSQIFFNYRLNKEEIALIKSDNERLISELIDKLRSEVASKFTTFEASNEGRRNELSKMMQHHFELSKEKIESIERQLKEDIIRIKIDLDKESGHVWKLRGVEANALRRFVKAALLQIETKTGNVKYTLEEIIKLLNEMKDIETDLVKGLEKVMTSTPEEYNELREQIRASIAGKPVYEFLPEPDPVTGLKYRYIKNSP